MVSVTFVLFFEDPYWIGLIEQSMDGRTEIGKIVFGAEPSNAELREFVLHKLGLVELHAVDESMLLLKRFAKRKGEPSRTKRSLEVYKNAVAAQATNRKATERRHAIELEEKKFELLKEKRKKRRQGH